MQVAETRDRLYIYIHITNKIKSLLGLTWTQMRWNHASFLQQGAHKVFTKSLVLTLS